MIHTKRQMADYTAKVMKQVELNPHMRTEGMYVPPRKTMADMPDEYLRKQLCQRAGRSLAGCEVCAGKCTVGKIMLERRATP